MEGRAHPEDLTTSSAHINDTPSPADSPRQGPLLNADKNGSYDGRTPSPSSAALDPNRPDVIPKSAPMNHHIPFPGGGPAPLDLSANPFSLFMGNPFGMLGGGGPGGLPANHPLLPHLTGAGKGGGGLPSPEQLGLILPPNSLAFLIVQLSSD